MDDGGTVSVTSVSSKNKTIESVLKACKVDLDLYEVASPKIRKWDVPIKQKDGDGATHLEIVECYYIGFSLIPKASIRIIAPIVAKVKFPVPVRNCKSEVSRTVVLSDFQIGYRKNQRTNALDPFHDRHALDVALQITQQVKPDTLILNGDILDMTEWSDKFAREPGFYFTTQPALFEAHYWLQRLRKALPDSRMIFLDGNHELRLKTTLQSHLLALAGIVGVDGLEIGSLATLLGLESLGIEYMGGYPNDYVDLGPIVVSHGNIARGKSPDTASALLGKIDKPHLIGHIHRHEYAVKTVNMSGVDKEIFAMTSGCLCRTDYVVPGHVRGQAWQQGFVILEHDANQVTPYHVPVRSGSAIFGGRNADENKGAPAPVFIRILAQPVFRVAVSYLDIAHPHIK